MLSLPSPRISFEPLVWLELPVLSPAFTPYTLHLTPKNRSSGRFGVFGTVFATCVCEMKHWHHAYIKKAMERGLTSHHHLVCAVGNNAMKHSYIVPPPPAASAYCMVLPLDVSWSPSSYCFVQVCGR